MFFKLLIALTLSSALLAPMSAPAFQNSSDEHIQMLEKLHNEAEGLIATNEFESALKKYDEILLLEPDDEVAYTNMGNIHLILGNQMKAQEAFWNALHINPDDEAAMAGLEKLRDPDGVLSAHAYQQTDLGPPAQSTPEPISENPQT